MMSSYPGPGPFPYPSASANYSPGALMGYQLPAGTRWSEATQTATLPDGTKISAVAGPDEVRRELEAYVERQEEREQEPKEFLAFCKAQFPDLVETFRRIRLVKQQFAAFAGQPEDK